MKNDKKQALAALHIAVLLFALSGLFAKWLALPATYIVFGRAIFSAIAIGLFVTLIKRQPLRCDVKSFMALMLTGAILAFHWASFFQAIQISSVALGLITFASFPVFVSFIEPIFFKEEFHLKTVFQAILTVVGIYLILPHSSLKDSDVQGVVWGILSAFSFALLTLMNRKFVIKISAKQVAFYQNSCAALFIIPFIVINPILPTANEILVLILLGVIFTAFAHSLFNFSLKALKAQTASIAVSLEPIYGIIAAYFLLNESISLMMILGGSIVLATNIWALKN